MKKQQLQEKAIYLPKGKLRDLVLVHLEKLGFASLVGKNAAFTYLIIGTKTVGSSSVTSLPLISIQDLEMEFDWCVKVTYLNKDQLKILDHLLNDIEYHYTLTYYGKRDRHPDCSYFYWGTELSFSEVELLAIPKTELKQKMKPQTLTKDQLVSLAHQFSCKPWREEITSLLKNKELLYGSTPIEIPEEKIALLIKEGTYEQKEAVKALGIKLGEIKKEELEMISKFEVRTGGKFKDQGFYLQKNYSWEIKTDESGVQVLIPTRK